MPEDPKDADLEFFNKLTKDTFRTNKELEEYYDQIESVYNSKLNFLLGKDTEIEGHEATEDDQGAESVIPSHHEQTYIFSSKFSNALVKLLNQYDYSSLLQDDHKELEDFYNAIEDEDEEDEFESEFESEDVEQIREGREELIEEFLEQEVELEEEELVQGNPEDSEEDDTAECESQHGCKGENLDSEKILFSLDNSSICNIYKLNLDNIKNMKLLYDYLEYNKSKNGSSMEKDISKSTYCSSFNKTIELYNEKSRCKSYYSDKKLCRELEESWNNYSHAQIPTLSCNIEKSASNLPRESDGDNELQEAILTSSSPGRGASSDSPTNSPSGDLSHAVSESPKGFPNPADVASTLQHTPGDMSEKHTLDTQEHITVSGHPNTEIASSADMAGTYLVDSEATNSCHNGSVGRSCKSSWQELSAMPAEIVNNLKQRQENTNMNTEPDTSLQEENGNTNTIVSSASSVLGVSALAFMLYKFTPLGSLINNRRGGINTLDINEEEYDENLLFSTALGNTNSNNNNYSIGYYSLGNT